MTLKLYSRGWRNDLRKFLSDIKRQLIIVSPYIRRREAEFVTDNLSSDANIITITKLEESSLSSGALEIGALNILGGFSDKSMIVNLPQLHAKIYVADKKRAIITSANLTSSGIDTNHEYGVGIAARATVRQICAHIDGYTELGRNIAVNELNNLESKVCAAMQKQKELQNRRVPESKQLRQAIRALDDECQQLHVGNDSPTALFKRAILYLLSKSGAMTTGELQEEIQRLYPGLCIDNANRIINGRNYGKLWKHHLRNAQQGLGKSDKIFYDPVSKKWILY